MNSRNWWVKKDPPVLKGLKQTTGSKSKTTTAHSDARVSHSNKIYIWIDNYSAERHRLVSKCNYTLFFFFYQSRLKVRKCPLDCLVSHFFSTLYLRKNKVGESRTMLHSSYNSPKTTC